MISPLTQTYQDGLGRQTHSSNDVCGRTRFPSVNFGVGVQRGAFPRFAGTSGRSVATGDFLSLSSEGTLLTVLMPLEILQTA